MGASARHGRVLGGRYEIIKPLASGGMAELLLARTTGIEGFERYVVVKRIHGKRANEPEIIKMFVDEARLAASLHHANIVQVHDIGVDAGEYFFAMEYLHGEDLRTLLIELSARRATMPIEHVITIISSAAAALHHAHEHRGSDRRPLELVHRDVSPANIIVGYDGTVKVVDFGVAKALVNSQDESDSGSLKGKISYMAPEQCLGQQIDRRSDVFALGVVLYELYTVRRLFKAGSDFLTMGAIVTGRIPKPSGLRSDTPPALEAIILKAIAMSPDDRFQSAGELRIALDRLADELGLRTSTTALADYMVHEIGRRPEPWLETEEETADDDVTSEVIDFDRYGTGLVELVGAPPDLPVPPGSPIARARTRAESQTAKPERVRHELSSVRTANGDDAVADLRKTATRTPMAWAPTWPTVGPRPRWPMTAALGAVVGIAAVLAIQLGDSGTHLTATSAAPPAPAEVQAPVILAPTPDAAPAPEAEAEAAPVTAPVTLPAAADDMAETTETTPPAKERSKSSHHAHGHGETSRPAKPTVRPASSPRSDPADNAAYDPDSLFLEKKP